MLTEVTNASRDSRASVLSVIAAVLKLVNPRSLMTAKIVSQSLSVSGPSASIALRAASIR
jgi:hypothetical protein